MSADEVRQRTQQAWDLFYSVTSIWRRSTIVGTVRERLAFVLVSKLYRQMYANTGIATDSARVSHSARWARWLAKPLQRLFAATPMPDLQVPPRSGGGYDPHRPKAPRSSADRVELSEVVSVD